MDEHLKVLRQEAASCADTPTTEAVHNLRLSFKRAVRTLKIIRFRSGMSGVQYSGAVPQLLEVIDLADQYEGQAEIMDGVTKESIDEHDSLSALRNRINRIAFDRGYDVKEVLFPDPKNGPRTKKRARS